jgi:hypothetical protein
MESYNVEVNSPVSMLTNNKFEELWEKVLVT